MRATVGVRRVHAARINVGTLARFAGGITWTEMLALGYTRAWWTMAIADAEERRLVAWSFADRKWLLTPAGRALTRSIS